MIASKSENDSSDLGANSFTYDELFSVLMYYYKMSKKDIYNSSRPFLISLYQNYVKRACENLGISGESEDSDKLNSNDYPKEFKKFSQKEREEHIKKDNITDEEYLARFSKVRKI